MSCEISCKNMQALVKYQQKSPGYFVYSPCIYPTLHDWSVAPREIIRLQMPRVTVCPVRSRSGARFSKLFKIFVFHNFVVRYFENRAPGRI